MVATQEIIQDRRLRLATLLIPQVAVQALVLQVHQVAVLEAAEALVALQVVVADADKTTINKKL